MGEQHGFYDIVFVMGIGNFIAAGSLYGFVQCAFTHLCTE